MSPSSGREVQILYVGDDSGPTEQAATDLKREESRFTVETASTVDEGLETLDALAIDCIVSEYDLPGRTGIEFLEAVRDTSPELPFILYTNAGSEAVASAAISAGVTDYLQKGDAANQYSALADSIENAVEQFHAQRELEAANERFSLLIDESPLGIVEWDTDLRFVQVNDAAEDMLGYSEADLVGKPCTEISPPEAQETVETMLSDAVEHTMDSHRVTETVRADGERIICEWHNRVVTSTREDVGTIVSQFQDITGRKRRERILEQLHETSRELMKAEDRTRVADIVAEAIRDILDIPINAVHLYDEAENCLKPAAWTEEAESFVDGKPTFGPGDGLAWEVFETGKFRLYDDVSTADGRFNPETSLRSELIHPLRDHGVLHAGAGDVAVFDDSDVSLVKILAATAATALDRIEQKAELGLERDRLRTLFEMVPEPIVLARFEAETPILVDANSAFEATFGYTVETVAGESITDLIVPPDRTEAAAALDKHAIAHGTVRKEVRRTTEDGLGDFLFRSVPVGESDHDEYLGIYIDISELKRYERRLEQQNEQLDMFAGVVSHDLRNPLMVARSGVEMAQQQMADDGQSFDSEAFDMVDRAHERMEQLVSDLLTLARQSEQTLDVVPISLAETSRSCWETVETDDAVLDVESTQLIHADESQLRHALENFVRNAIEHAGSDVTVTIGDLAGGFYIEDDGDGIPPEKRDQVFEKEYTSSSNGTGFGLFIIKQVVDAHDWDITVSESNEGGARFEITGVKTEVVDE